MNINSSLCKNIFKAFNSPLRKYCDHIPGIKYEGFTYYPRTKDFKDPPYEPSKLFLVTRIKSMVGRTKVEKQYLAQLNIDGYKKHNGHINVVKNIPPINALLWKVKHLIEIKPITWKGDLPEDHLGTYLRETGELVISQKLKLSPEQIEASEKLAAEEKKPDRQYLREYLHRKWWHGFTGTA